MDALLDLRACLLPRHAQVVEADRAVQIGNFRRAIRSISRNRGTSQSPKSLCVSLQRNYRIMIARLFRISEWGDGAMDRHGPHGLLMTRRE